MVCLRPERALVAPDGSDVRCYSLEILFNTLRSKWPSHGRLNCPFCRRFTRRQTHVASPRRILPTHRQDASHGLPRRRVSTGNANEKTRAATAARAHAPRSTTPSRHATQHDAVAQKRLLERVLKLRQGEALLLLDDGLLFHNLDIHGIPPEPLHDVLVDPGRRR